MFEKKLEEITKVLDNDIRLMRVLRIKLLMFCGLGHIIAAATTLSAFETHHIGWGVTLVAAWSLLIVWTIRLITFKI